MQRNTLKKFIITSIILFLAGIIIQLFQTSYIGKEDKNIAAFPDLYENINNIELITIKNSNNEIDIVKQNDNWTIKELNYYNADLTQVNNLLKSIALMIFKNKLNYNPNLYYKNHLLDTNYNGAISLFGKNNDEMVSFIIGDRKYGVSGILLGSYIRKSDEQDAFLAETNIDATGDALSWVNTEIISINKAYITSIIPEKPLHFGLNIVSDFLFKLKFIYTIPINPENAKKLSKINSIKFKLQNILDITVDLYKSDNTYFINLTSELTSNVVPAEINVLHEHIMKNRSQWLYQIPINKASIISVKNENN